MSYKVIMSKNLKDQARIKKMAQKYAKFIAKNAQVAKQSSYGWLQSLVQKCESCWCKLIPPSVRDFRGEFEIFNDCWKTQTGKVCSNELISHRSLEENLISYTPDGPVVVGLVYSTHSIQKTLNFVNHLRVEQLKSEIVICPINVEGRKYREQIEPKIVLLDESVCVFWRGLFNEMILLHKWYLNDIDIFKSIKEEVSARTEYETRIREFSQGSKINESNSQALI